MSQSEMIRSLYNNYLNEQKVNENNALALLNLVAKLKENNVTVTFFGKTLNVGIADIIAIHHDAGVELQATLAKAQEILEQSLANLAIDLGQLVKTGQDAKSVADHNPTLANDVVLYGFGRIGRILARLFAEENTSDLGLQLRAVAVRPAASVAADLAKRASLLQRDSVHGRFHGTVIVDEANEGIVINGRFVKVIYANEPSEIDYTAYGINNALVIDNTGKFKDEAGLGKHLQAKGVRKVLLTAPAKGEIKNIVYGVNQDMIGSHDIVSAASCTTNAITPALKVIHDRFGICDGHVETIHAFTNDQNLIDNQHKSDRRGRAATLNMVITETGAAKAVGKALPELNGKLSGSSIRVPVPNVSMAILNLNLAQETNKEEINHFFKDISTDIQWQDQILYSDSSEAVSSDFVGEHKVAIFDAKATIVNGKRATLYLWYDNEVGYSTQVIRVAKYMMR